MFSILSGLLRSFYAAHMCRYGRVGNVVVECAGTGG